MTGWLFLPGAIVAEVIATRGCRPSIRAVRIEGRQPPARKPVAGLSRPRPLAVTVVGYVIAFSLMSLSLKTIPLGIAYAVWSGVGIVAISIIGLIAFGQRLDAAAVAGIALIVSGVALIQLCSKSQA
ncbi:MAG: multidrug efflux SMR transporter [Pseudomonadota bacterium]